MDCKMLVALLSLMVAGTSATNHETCVAFLTPSDLHNLVCEDKDDVPKCVLEKAFDVLEDDGTSWARNKMDTWLATYITDDTTKTAATARLETCHGTHGAVLNVAVMACCLCDGTDCANLAGNDDSPQPPPSTGGEPEQTDCVAAFATDAQITTNCASDANPAVCALKALSVLNGDFTMWDTNGIWTWIKAKTEDDRALRADVSRSLRNCYYKYKTNLNVDPMVCCLCGKPEGCQNDGGADTDGAGGSEPIPDGVCEAAFTPTHEITAYCADDVNSGGDSAACLLKILNVRDDGSSTWSTTGTWNWIKSNTLDNPALHAEVKAKTLSCYQQHNSIQRLDPMICCLCAAAPDCSSYNLPDPGPSPCDRAIADVELYKQGCEGSELEINKCAAAKMRLLSPTGGYLSYYRVRSWLVNHFGEEYSGDIRRALLMRCLNGNTGNFNMMAILECVCTYMEWAFTTAG